MNGHKIYTDTSIISIQKKFGKHIYETGGWTSEGIKEYLLSNLKDELAKLDDYTYSIELQNIVVDEKGQIVYFDYDGISSRQRWNAKGLIEHNIPQDVKDDFKNKVYTVPRSSSSVSVKTGSGVFASRHRPCTLA